MAVDLDLGKDALDPALFVDHERRALDSYRLAPVAALLLPDSVALAYVPLRVGEERIRQPLLLAKAMLALDFVLGDAEDLGVGATQVGERRLEVARLAGSARRHRLGEEEEDDLPAAEVGQADVAAFRRGEVEIGCGIANLELGHVAPFMGRIEEGNLPDSVQSC